MSIPTLLDTEFEKRCRAVVESLGLCDKTDLSSIKRLDGGVSSDIAVVEFGQNSNQKSVCIKFAVEKLRVAVDWYAPVNRSRAEFAWLSVVAQIVPGAVPQLYGWSESENGFAMEYIKGPDVSLWKTDLLAGETTNGEAVLEVGSVARGVARILGEIHSTSGKKTFDPTPFNNAADFKSLRIDPYLLFTAHRYPELSANIRSIADQLAQSRRVLIHGDVSPKNIIVNGPQPVMLDAECASMGDPAFDVAFCLNHLLLKSIHMPGCAMSLQTAVAEFWETYAVYIDWEDTAAVEARVAALLPVLMLARVDGKSPVEYLGEESRAHIRKISEHLIKKPANGIRALLNELSVGTPA